MQKMLKILRELFKYYNDKHIPRAAAALSYYLTMTFFPMIVCLYALLGRNYLRVMQSLDFVSQFISAKTTDMLRSFMAHVVSNQSSGILYASLAVLVTSASAAERTLQGTIGEMQGRQRFQGIKDFLFSVLFSLAFVVAIYFAILVLFTGKDFLELINGYLPFVDISSSWRWIRFLLLGGISFVLFWTIYALACPRNEPYPCFFGALFSTIGAVVMSLIFSNFIAISTRYPLLYGSLASIILLMFWLYLNCQVIYLGAAVNLAVRDVCGEK